MSDDLFDIAFVYVGDGLVHLDIDCIHCSNKNRNYAVTDVYFHCQYCRKRYKVDISKTKEYRDVAYRNPYSHLFRKGGKLPVLVISGPETAIPVLQDTKDLLVDGWGWQVIAPEDWKRVNFGKYTEYVQQQYNGLHNTKKPCLIHLPGGRRFYMFILQLRGKVEVALERS